ncbi:hypothetical protein ACHQM5_003543 [Ranunculus cassubicifolius]
MSSKRDEKALAAAERLKGMSRVQSEKAAASATRNLNAYGQKEEGPSLRQIKKERLRAMYVYSTEKAVVLGERKGLKNLPDTSNMASQCQKCFGHGHWSFECKNERAYVSRPSQTKQIKNPRLKRKLSVSYDGNPDILPPPEEKKDENDSKISRSKCHQHSDSISDTGSDHSSVVSGSDSSPGTGGSSNSSCSESEEEKRGKKNKSYKRRKHHKYSSTSESSDSYSDSDSDSDSGSDKEEERKRRNKKSYKKRKHHKYSSTSESSDSYSDSDSGSDKKKSRRHHKRQ